MTARVRCKKCGNARGRRTRCRKCKRMLCSWCIGIVGSRICTECVPARIYFNRPNHRFHDCMAFVGGLVVYGRHRYGDEPLRRPGKRRGRLPWVGEEFYHGG